MRIPNPKPRTSNPLPLTTDHCSLTTTPNLTPLLALLFVLALTSTTYAQPADHLPSIPKGTIAIRLETVADQMAAPDYAISPPGDTSRLFVVEQNGLLRIIQNGSLLPGAALDLAPRISTAFNSSNANDERGFLGLAFHPGFNNPASPGYQTLYTYNSEPVASNPNPTFPLPVPTATPNFNLVVNEFRMSAGNPNLVDTSTRREVMTIAHNANNHNGGTLAFGPDGYLYLAPGDGGNANDAGASHVEPTGNAQLLTNPLGKVLRIDPINPALTPASANPVSANGAYRVPADNPFQGAGQVKEIYAYGLRNPYRFSFDRGGANDLILADVGQNNIEEINRITRGGNYGWAVKEGTFTFDRATGNVIANSPGSPAGMIDPISGPLGTLQYDHQDGISITGGFVYRGTAIPELVGKYVFGDLAIRGGPRVDGRLFYADLEDGTIHEFLLPQFVDDQIPNGLTVHGFGEDGLGELYALVTNTPANGTGGIVYKLVAIPEPTTISLLTLSALTLMRRRR